MGEHRVPLLGAAWRRNDDPALSRDPRVQAVVGALATLPAPEMDAQYRAELRAQLVAITPRIVAESADVTRPLATTPSAAASAAHSRPTPQGRPASARSAARHSDSVLARLRGAHFGRPLAVAASVIVAFALLLGGAVMMSQKSLPGDALYGLKRAGERFELATAGSNVDKAKDHLEFATNRVQEAAALAKRLGGSALGGAHAAGGGGQTADLIRSTLQSSDGDVRSAAQLLGTDAVRHSSATSLSAMTSWAPAQEQRLRALAGSLPDPALRAQALSSLHLVQAAQARATALASKVGCSCLGSAGSDALGPKPCSPCTSSPAAPRHSSAPARHATGSAHPRSNGTVPGGSSRQGGAVTVPTSSAGAPSGSTAPGGLGGLPSTTPITLPSLPTGTPTLPISGNSCGASLSLPLLGGAQVGLCSGVNVNLGH